MDRRSLITNAADHDARKLHSVAAPYRSNKAAVVGPNRALVGASIASAIAAVAVTALWGIAAGPLIVLLGAAGIGAAASARERRWPHFDRGLVEADASGVRLRGRTLAKREDITQGFAMPIGDGCVVRLHRRFPRRPIDLAVWDEEEGRKLLVALGLDASQTTAELSGGSAIARLPPSSRFMLGAALAAVIIGVGALASLPGWWWLLLIPLARFTTARPSTIRIGVDGVHFRWLWLSTFTPFSTVRSIALRQEEKQAFADLRLTDGRKVALPLGKGGDAEHIAYRRIEQAFEAYQARQGSAGTEALARGGRTPLEWLTSLRGLAAGANAGMRTAHIASERLWTIVEDPSAPPAARAGAAAALASSATDDERKRIRIAAGSIAEPRLRVAVEKAADESVAEAELAEALAEVEQEWSTRAS